MPTANQPATLPDLAAIRQRKGISLKDIADRTKISTRYLQAIEAGDFQQLPGGVFATSYIRQYALAIDYDEWDILACYRSVVPEIDVMPVLPEEPRRGLVPSLLRLLGGRASARAGR
jgi:cytoskeletal protein RodZ